MTRTAAEARRAQGLGNMSDLAAILGVTVAAVREAIAKGRLEREAGGWLHLESQAQRFRATSVGSRNGHGARPADDGEQLGYDALAAGTAGATADGGESFAAARTRREIAQADLAEVKARETRGELVTVAEAERLWFGATRALRSRLMALPDVLAGRMVGRSRAELRKILDAELRAVLTELSDKMPQE